MTTMYQTVAGRWHATRYPDATCEHVLLKAIEELGEATRAWNAVVGVNAATGAIGDKDEFVKECADTVITLLVAVQRYTDGDLFSAVWDKLKILNTPGAHKSGVINWTKGRNDNN